MANFLDNLEMIRLNTKIPASLRSVAPFLDEALHTLRTKMQSLRDTVKSLKIAICCMDHAFYMLDKFDFPLDAAGVACLKVFHTLRQEAIAALHSEGEVAPVLRLSSTTADPSEPVLNDVLLEEANNTLELADQQAEADAMSDAAQNYHAATIYYRVIEAVMALSLDHQAKMEYAAHRTRQCSHLIENFVLEHFSGVRCGDVYDIDMTQIGHGTYGTVHICKHRKTGDSFACKMISLSRINSEHLRKLHLEIAIMKSIDHPNIVQLKEVFYGSKVVYLVMELCEGGELFDQVTDRRKGFPEAHAAKLMRDMLAAVNYLHGHNIVHRDIKLENFLFERNSSMAHLKLIDFGLAKYYDEHENMRSFCGSAYYTAPEILNGFYDYRCDIWSLGVIAYMLLCCSPPFHGSKEDEIHTMILNAELNLSYTRFPNTSPQAFDFLQKVLQKDPAHRISIAEALNHPFILMAEYFDKIEPHDSTVEIVNNLTHFLHMSKVKKLILKLVAFTLSSSQIEELRADYFAIDTDRNGVVSLGELRSALMRKNVRQDKIDTIFQSISASGLGEAEINYSDFLAAAMLKRITINEEKLELAFESLDLDGSGFIDIAELRNSLGADQSDELIDDVLKELDSNHDGKVDYREFLKYWKSLERAERVSPLKRFAMTVKKTMATLDATVLLMRKEKTVELLRSFLV